MLQLIPEEADNVWFGVCQNKKKHIDICKGFLAEYKRYARCKRLNIDRPEEYKEEATVRSVLTIIRTSEVEHLTQTKKKKKGCQSRGWNSSASSNHYHCRNTEGTEVPSRSPVSGRDYSLC